MSSKFSSPLFSGTNGATLNELGDMFEEISGPTATVWDYISCTDENYPGTQIPRSFTVETPSGQFWTHGNATEHMYEAVTSLKSSYAMTQSNPHLLGQFVLYDYREALAAVVKHGIRFNRIYREGHWEFKFSKRPGDKLPVVVHAMFKGF